MKPEIMIQIVNQVLPKHLWVNKYGGLFHQDYPIYRPDLCAANGERLLERQHIGYVTDEYSWIEAEIEAESIFIVLFGNPQSPIHFCRFLQEVGGTLNMYKELVTLLTGENPWRSNEF